MTKNLIIFKEKQIKSFSQFSRDKNPLHINYEYASLTPFSDRVLYGMAGVFFLLSKINLKKSEISSLKIEFKKPIFINKVYYFSIHKNKNEIYLKIFKGNIDYTKVKINIINQIIKTELKFSISSLVKNKLLLNNPKWNLIPNKNKFKDIRNSFPGIENCHFWILQVLAWSSYWVGMIYPGQQALFTQFQLNVKKNNIKFQYGENKFHKVLKQNRTFFTSADGSSISMISFLRPKPVQLLNPSIFRNQNNVLKNYTCVVTGGTRGIGSVFSQIFSSKGAHVLSSYKNNKKSAMKIEKFIKSRKKLFKSFCYNKKSKFKKFFLDKKINCLVLNATPAIKQIDPSEISRKEFNIEVRKFFDLTINDLEFYRNYLSENATIINVSSTFIDEQPKGFAHYYNAKKAVENFLIDFSLKNPRLTVLNFRLPKMHTDQTNVNNIDNSIQPPERIIKRVTNHYLSFKSKKGYHTFNIV